VPIYSNCSIQIVVEGLSTYGTTKFLSAPFILKTSKSIAV